MTKLLYCNECGFIGNARKDEPTTTCWCGRHTFWWSENGSFHVHDHEHPDGPKPGDKACHVLGLMNAFLRHGGAMTTKGIVENLLRRCPPSSLLSDAESPVVKVRVGAGGTTYSDPPTEDNDG
jgi:hypothetical protein